MIFSGAVLVARNGKEVIQKQRGVLINWNAFPVPQSVHEGFKHIFILLLPLSIVDSIGNPLSGSKAIKQGLVVFVI